MSLSGRSKKPELKTLLRSEVPLSRYSTFQIGGKARYFSEPRNLTQLQALLEFSRGEDLPLLVIGKGSNILFPDEGFGGLVVTLIHFEQDQVVIDPDQGHMTVSSGVNLYRLALAARQAGLGGAEFLGHIPGTVGGAVMMNAGFSRFRGVKKEIGDLIEKVNVLTPEGQVRELDRSELVFQYRETNLKGQIILGARFKLRSAKPEDVQAEIQANFAYRNGVQDLRYPSAGSVFKNPLPQRGEGRVRGESSGQLIEKAGLKGKRAGGAMISERHANFIVNLGGARASDVLELVTLAQEKVFEAFGVHLEPEIRIVSSPHEIVSVTS